ncbi:UNVERIFIED_CONTAM: hypothetical protein K2H54_061433 [Gekko kuhli]
MEDCNLSGPKLTEGGERSGKSPRIIQVGTIRELLNWAAPWEVKEEPDEGLSQRWEAQWQEFLRAMQSPQLGWGSPQLMEDAALWGDNKAFFASFERLATTCKLPRREWLARLLPVLSREAREAYSNLSLQDRGEYAKVKAAILRRLETRVVNWPETKPSPAGPGLKRFCREAKPEESRVLDNASSSSDRMEKRATRSTENGLKPVLIVYDIVGKVLVHKAMEEVCAMQAGR